MSSIPEQAPNQRSSISVIEVDLNQATINVDRFGDENDNQPLLKEDQNAAKKKRQMLVAALALMVLVLGAAGAVLGVCLSGLCSSSNDDKSNQSEPLVPVNVTAVPSSFRPTAAPSALASSSGDNNETETTTSTTTDSNIFDQQTHAQSNVTSDASSSAEDDDTASTDDFMESNTTALNEYLNATLSDNSTESLFQELEDDDTESVAFSSTYKDFFGAFEGLVGDDVQTTPMEAFDGKSDCTNFIDSTAQPNTIHQCQCNGTISRVADDVQELYLRLKNEMMSELYDQGWEENITSCHPTNQALLWLASGDTRRAGDLGQRFLVASLYMAWNGTNWGGSNDGRRFLSNETTLWLSDQNECEWAGVQCDRNNQIVSLELDMVNIFGRIPSQVGLLGGLETLSITRSHLTGTIPTYLFRLPNLTELTLAANQLTGKIPSEVGLATNLEVLDLDNNWMYGTLVTELGLLSNLILLSVGFNQYIRSIPSELGQCSELRSLTMEDNRISGTFPTTIGQWTSLERMLMTENLMTGSLPTEVGLMTSMRDFRIADIGMHGRIPSQLGLLTDMWRLDIGEQFFSGTLPTELGLLSDLYKMALLKNDITGTIPTQFGQLSNMTRLDMHELHLSGTLPSELGQMENLVDFLLDENDITGTISSQICELRELRLVKFIVDCPTSTGRGVGVYAQGGINELLEIEGNCFTICRRGG